MGEVALGEGLVELDREGVDDADVHELPVDEAAADTDPPPLMRYTSALPVSK